LHGLRGDGEELSGDGRGDGRGGGAGGPAGGGQSGPGVEGGCAGGEFGQDVGAVAGVGLAAQVGEEFAGFGGGAAGGAGDESGLLPDAGGVDVRGGRRAGESVGGEGHAVQGLGDGVVHLAGEAGPFRADRFGDGEAGPHLGEGAGGLGEAEHELAQGGSGGARDDAQAGQEQGFRGAGVRVVEGGV